MQFSLLIPGRIPIVGHFPMSSSTSTALFILLLAVAALAAPSTESEEIMPQKRRMGMRLPNLLSLRDEMQGISKRRIGMRLPNIIYLRDDHAAEKKFAHMPW